MASESEIVYDYSKTARKVIIINPFIETWAYNSSGLIEYHGLAQAGKNFGSADWAIEKYYYSGNNLIKKWWASSTANKFTHIWSGAGSVSTTYEDYTYG